MFRGKGDSNMVYKCTVRLLDDTEILECEFHPSYKGKYLLDHVCQQLGVTETDYFGLRYVDATGQRHWLHMAKTILKQVKDCSPILFSFRVKFYPPNPLVLGEGACRAQLCRQVRRDLLHGRLYTTPNEAAMLAALIIQAELGDYDPNIHVGNYIADMRLLLRQTDAIEARIMELHREPAEGTEGAEGGPGGAGAGGVGGLSPLEAERAFLQLACQLETYGLDPHPVKDHRGTQLYLGINHAGVQTYHAGRKLNHFRWTDVQKINFEGRMFIVHLNYPEKKHTVGFKCPSGAACRHVWCCAIEQMLFFTLPSSSDAGVYSGGGLFSWGTKFKYYGRTEREIMERDGLLPPRDTGEEGGGGKRKANSVPATPSTPMTSDFSRQSVSGYGSLPRSTHSAPLGALGGLGGMAGAGGTGELECNGGCLLSGPAVDIALAGCEHAPAHQLLPTTHLQPLSEECSRTAQDGDQPAEYPYREFDESSESQLTSHTAATDAHRNDEWSRPPSVDNSPNAVAAIVNPQPTVRKFSLLRTFVPSFVFVTLVLVISIVLLFELDAPALDGLKRKPEMVSLYYHYYRPMKQYLKRTVVDHI